MRKSLASPEGGKKGSSVCAVRFTDIRMDWTDTGAVIYISNSKIPIICPLCRIGVTPGIEHRCGDRAIPAPTASTKPKRKRAAKA